MPHNSFRTHPSHHLPTAMARYDYNYTAGSPWKGWTRHSLVWQPRPLLFFSSLCQFLVSARACNESRKWCCCSALVPLQGRLLIFSLIFKGFSLLLERLVTSWRFDDMPCATWAEQKYFACCALSVFVVVAGGQMLTHHPDLRTDRDTRCAEIKGHVKDYSSESRATKCA